MLSRDHQLFTCNRTVSGIGRSTALAGFAFLCFAFQAEAIGEEIKLDCRVDSLGTVAGNPLKVDRLLPVDLKNQTIEIDGKVVAGQLATFALDTERQMLKYDIADWIKTTPDLEAVAYLHGFAPPGWESAIIRRIDLAATKSGELDFNEADMKNFRAGLAYVTVHSKRLPTGRVRGQIKSTEPPTTMFPNSAESTLGDGKCFAKLTIFGVVDQAELEMDSAQVAIMRLAPGDSNGNGRRDVVLKANIEMGGGYCPGIGQIDIKMLGVCPGMVEARQIDTDFPADMTLKLHKKYITPIGTFVGEEEPFKATNITAFPPFGAYLYPQVEKVRLLDEKTKKHVGYLHLGTVVQVSHIDPHEFPRAKLDPRTIITPIPKFFGDQPKAKVD